MPWQHPVQMLHSRRLLTPVTWRAGDQASLITRRLPGNGIGWLLGLVGLLVAAEMLTEQYTVYGLATAPGSLPGAHLAGWFSTVAVNLAVFLLPVLLLLFPDGRLPSRRWRPVLWAILAAMAGSVAGQMQAGRVIDGVTDVLDTTGSTYPNPVGIFPRGTVGSALLSPWPTSWL